MNKLNELLKQNEITAEEERIFRKVQKRYYLEDLKNYIEEHKGNYTKKQLDTIYNNIGAIIDRYSEHFGEDWQIVMDCAIDWVINWG